MDNNNDIISDEEFEALVEEHFEWCDDCESSRDAYRHELDLRGELNS